MALINVVLVGLGLGGAPAAKDLAKSLPATHRLVCITAQDFGFYPVASLRAAVVPSWESSITAPLDKLFPPGSRHIILSSTNVISLSPTSIEIDKAFEGATTIEFAYAVLSTGSSYAVPCRPLDGDNTIEQVNATFQKLQNDVKAAIKVLIVGGGATGIEMAGEIRHNYKDTPITLVHSGSAFFETGFNKGVGASLLGQCKAANVDVVFNQRVDTKGLKTGPIPLTKFKVGDKEVEADYLYIAYGVTPNSSLVSADLRDSAGRIKVRPTLQLATSDGTLANIFAIGDCNDVEETKLSINAQAQIPTLVANIIALIKSPGATLKSHSPARPIILVTFGPSGGAGQVFGVVVGAWLASKMKSSSLFVGKFKSSYNV